MSSNALCCDLTLELKIRTEMLLIKNSWKLKVFCSLIRWDHMSSPTTCLHSDSEFVLLQVDRINVILECASLLTFCLCGCECLHINALLKSIHPNTKPACH